MKCCCQISLKKEKIQGFPTLICPRCGLITKATRVSFQEEKKRYDAHICDRGYIRYMEGLYEKLKQYIKGFFALDYGCGKIHILADILNQDGMQCDYYDLHYFPILSDKEYDTILLIEVFEHLYEPYDELLKLQNMLKPKGRIIIVTKPYDGVDLEQWWYFRDITHISFINEKTLSFWDLDLKIIDHFGDIFVLERI
ncbi:MAG: class I SAM-dependent methyltransferase [Roseburia sp.]|nr:class I SAM-dependent methyltransferase [Anaeroplasma bactoclasticum]MCM1197010.1 class I SAM-dependent methyltransferase [Roseburia sp.]MCM1557392.1 class I SAM-dependent methyltransferase [Anaeroplasma bactoclasticum]